ncbi:hypothetical protein DCO58_03345 [Helicobacter saguini]|uniref:Uncharacterized protein n=1 Tax=Helicobacter saguini TaxID=1548018 RepID=A0A347VS99_9HELI|nr:hypothetical protein [Helicobacter saguini]MWV62593.1 hypothetical protein [Helicobacter saguini]MWV66733.1 hypothetical protein [Helicobacter saguini]MWV69084.1 hypothetical protein [Helicobacter saguini]MWV71362.1 hypothetical protein [Helicobacter saguini]TLD93998.1 hypothetical protein LS64_007505 [Helicobacter saguini]
MDNINNEKLANIEITESDNVPEILHIRITDRAGERSFKINLSHLDSKTRLRIIESFENTSYSIENILEKFILNLRDQASAEFEIIKLIEKFRNG